MKPSTHPLEIDLGMRYYATSQPGIGGRLRTTPEDFVVEELPITFTNTGPYTICKLTKRSWEHQHAMHEITNRLRISQKRIGWAGTKDKNAVTTQYISLYNVPAEAAANLNIKDMTIEPVATHQFSLGLGNLLGNRFKITLRDCEPNDLAKNTAEISGEIAAGIPNYYGLQRFGALKPVTHKMGYHILRKEFKEAVDLYVGGCFPYESEQVQTARKNFAETGDAKTALYELPPWLSYERIMLDSLAKNPGDYGAALQAMPPKLLSMFVSAYQSWLFNIALSKRCEENAPLNEPRVGEHLEFTNGRVDTVTEKNIATARQHMKRGRCFIVGWMPGKTLPVAPGPLEETMFAQMEKDNISMQSFADATEFVKTNFDGAHRRISLATEVETAVFENNVQLNFVLPPGHYATTVAREFMQAAPEKMV
ncbi:tRNA pseudouridine synthase D, TruD [Methanocorpusculum labreanum Z]|uniref:Probable tRNA pseudouridine synthase D n=1 Tax=Methanocorpusculum labreanum (strain ATCC 43576 / DSM 4855 / Z) TaxID=410358 RepID=A2SRL8_METLZ|nr:tRNA pseudouridine(13) synthase TruD [Methanocorpusculum labreanum]ABN06974.1 tRNA pseudouridine synthase D, TruD [Methanocorpusculum labreanum Z]